MTDEAVPTQRGSWPRVIWAVLLSLTIPGLGQIYARAWLAGIVLIVVNILLEATLRVGTRMLPPTPPMIAGGMLLIGWSLALRLGATWDAARRVRGHFDPARRNWQRSTGFAAVLCIVLFVALAELLPLGWRPFNVPSVSNLPTLRVGDYVLSDVRDAGWIPSPGDMVFFSLPADSSVTYVKRVIGLPGDRVQLRSGQLYVNGQAARRDPTGEIEDESSGHKVTLRCYFETLPNGRQYEIATTTDEGVLNNTQEFAVPTGHLFVLGDNRDNSSDSRMSDQVGYIPFGNLIGKAVTIYWARDQSRVFSLVD